MPLAQTYVGGKLVPPKKKKNEKETHLDAFRSSEGSGMRKYGDLCVFPFNFTHSPLVLVVLRGHFFFARVLNSRWRFRRNRAGRGKLFWNPGSSHGVGSSVFSAIF